jgi:hypothetical protein
MNWDAIDLHVLDNRTLQVTFRDGIKGTVRFEATAFRGVFEQLLDVERFRAAKIVDGVVTWPDPVAPGGVDDLDLAPDAMHDKIAADGEMVLK